MYLSLSDNAAVMVAVVVKQVVRMYSWFSTHLRFGLRSIKLLNGLDLIYFLCFCVGVEWISRLLYVGMGWVWFGFVAISRPNCVAHGGVCG
jgi:hypothetical protein